MEDIIGQNNFNKIYILLKMKYNEYLVCCVYNENIEWILECVDDYKYIYIYIKNRNRVDYIRNMFVNMYNVIVIEIENIGSCDHVYLYHIIENYDNLDGIIYFSKGTNRLITKEFKNYKRYLILNYMLLLCVLLFIILSIVRKKKFLIPTIICLVLFIIFLKILHNNDNIYYDTPNNIDYRNVNEIKYTENSVANFNTPTWKFSYNTGAKFKFIRSKHSNLKNYMLSLFSKQFVEYLLNGNKNIIYKGYFKVDSTNIHRYPKELYESLIDFKTKSSNREIDHFHERIWGLLFSTPTNTNIQIF